jgi:hypothetical protein
MTYLSCEASRRFRTKDYQSSLIPLYKFLIPDGLGQFFDE